MESTACAWQVFAVALIAKGEETAAPAAGLVTEIAVGVVGEDGEEGVPVTDFAVAGGFPHPATHNTTRKAERTRYFKFITSDPEPIAHTRGLALGKRRNVPLLSWRPPPSTCY